jgi:hypothetical protein
MGNFFDSSHKTALLIANQCFSDFDNYIFDLKTLSTVKNEQKNELLFSIENLQNALRNIQVKTLGEQEQQQKMCHELERTKQNLRNFDLRRSQTEKLDHAAILEHTNVVPDICLFLESILNKSQSKYKQNETSFSRKN